MPEPVTLGSCDEFYIGYLRPAPRGYARRVRAAVLSLAVLVVGVSALIAVAQRGTGHGVWESEPATMIGMFLAMPYPVLLTEGGAGEPRPRTVILVGAGKCGAFEPSGYCGMLGGRGGEDARRAARAAAIRMFDGRLVQVRGTRLHRAGRMAMELAEDDRAVVVAPEDPARAAALRPSDGAWTEARIRGTIIDPKCYLGAMRPGEGQAHRACAVRCIAGGIPPMLTEAGRDGPRFYLLADAAGAAVNEALLPFVGDEVEVRGTAAWLDRDIAILRVDSGSITRR